MDDNALFELSLTDEMGEIGVMNVNINNNNVDATMWNNSLLSKFFFFRDPRKTYNWSDEIWKDIENREIFRGMTVQQAVMSWGEPDETTELKDGTMKYKYGSGSSFLVRANKVYDFRQH